MAPHDARSLLALLQQHEILPQDSQGALPPLERQFPAAPDFARELVRRGLLTPFQANEIMQGRAARLVLGQYLLLERLGQGGMGEVFKAHHRVLERLVALKVIRPEFVNHADAVERFRRECRAAGRLSHPNIVTVHDAHQVGDVHFLAMEYLEGKDLSRLLKERGALPPGEACECTRQAALGLQHAHEKGMVHRDVKPANLMLTTAGVVKVLDLGLARLRAAADGAPNSDLTRAGSVMGTPDYIAPEQAAGDTASADARADVYSLGCTLFHLLTGQPPFPGKSVREKIAAHLTQPPPRLDEATPGTPPALAVVVRRMMEKEPAARFATADEVAAALAPFCQAVAAAPIQSPISATVTYVPPLKGGRKVPFRWIAAAVAALIGCCGLGLLAWRMLSPPARVGPPNAAVLPDKDKGPVRPTDPPPGPVVPPAINLPPPPKHAAVRDGLAWPPPDCIALLGDDRGRHWGAVRGVAFRPDGAVIATADQIGRRAFIHLWDAATLKERAAWTPVGAAVLDLAYSPNGRQLAAVCGDGLRLWDADDDGLSHERKFGKIAPGPGSNLFHLLFTADGQSLLAWDAVGVVHRWRLTNGDPGEDGDPSPAPPNFYALAVSADGRKMAYSRYDRATGKQLVCVKSLIDPQAVETTADIPAGAGALAFSADGNRLAARVSIGASELHLWDVDGGKLQERKTVDLSKLGLSNFVAAFVFTPDGKKILDVSAPRGGPSAVWMFDATSGEATQLDGMDGQATGLSMPSDGRRIAAAGKDHRLRLWDAGNGSYVLRPSGPAAAGPWQHMAFRRGGIDLAMVARLDERPEGTSDPSNLIIWDVSKGKERAIIPTDGWFTDCAYTPDGGRLFAVGTTPGKDGPMPTYREGVLRVWRADDLKEEASPKLPPNLKGISLESLAFDHDGKTLALLGGDDAHRRAAVCDVQPFRVRGDPFEVGSLLDSLTLSPDGATAATLAVRGLERTTPCVKFWDLKGIAGGPPDAVDPNPPLEGAPSQSARRLTFSPDGKTLAALVKMGPFLDETRKVLLWDVATSTTRAAGDPRDTRSYNVAAFAFSPDSRTLATADADGHVTLWHADKPQEKVREWEFPGPVCSVAFDESGSLLAVGDADGTIAVLRLPAP